jgi:hypothetical protein
MGKAKSPTVYDVLCCPVCHQVYAPDVLKEARCLYCSHRARPDQIGPRDLRNAHADGRISDYSFNRVTGK